MSGYYNPDTTDAIISKTDILENRVSKLEEKKPAVKLPKSYWVARWSFVILAWTVMSFSGILGERFAPEYWFKLGVLAILLAIVAGAVDSFIYWLVNKDRI